MQFQLVSHLVVSCFALMLVTTEAAIVPPPWSNPITNPCANMSGGWQLLYWPPLNKCFKIFTIGYPCPESMELSPTIVSRKINFQQQNVPPAECRCPPGTAFDEKTNKCHRLFERGPCEFGQFFGPIVDFENRNGNRLGICRNPSECPDDMTFWPNDGKCYKQFKRGPCPKGKLLIDLQNGYGECKCEGAGLLKKYYYELEQTCYEHYTKGPCTTPGHLFLPNGKCDCHSYMPHYHKEYRMCFELNTPGPCPFGHIFKLPENENGTFNVYAECECKDDFVKWSDGNCYRLYTRGPCKTNEFLLSSTRCVQNICNKAQLYFPEEGTCYRIGSQGPCPQQQVVVFDYSARPSVEGISYKGVCGCSGIIKDLEQQCLYYEEPKKKKIPNDCLSNSGMVKYNDTCYKLYTQGPCQPDQWLIPKKDSLITNHGNNRQEYKNEAKCVCRQNSNDTDDIDKDTNTDTDTDDNNTQCSTPNVSLARWFLELLG